MKTRQSMQKARKKLLVLMFTEMMEMPVIVPETANEICQTTSSDFWTMTDLNMCNSLDNRGMFASIIV